MKFWDKHQLRQFHIIKLHDTIIFSIQMIYIYQSKLFLLNRNDILYNENKHVTMYVIRRIDESNDDETRVWRSQC